LGTKILNFLGLDGMMHTGVGSTKYRFTATPYEPAKEDKRLRRRLRSGVMPPCTSATTPCRLFDLSHYIAAPSSDYPQIVGTPMIAAPFTINWLWKPDFAPSLQRASPGRCRLLLLHFAQANGLITAFANQHPQVAIWHAGGVVSPPRSTPMTNPRTAIITGASRRHRAGDRHCVNAAGWQVRLQWAPCQRP
jgi:hypothetical protein